MELFYCFFLGPVAVAGVITNSRKKNGDIISPVNKSIEIKPGVLLSLNGPYEDNMEYLEYFKGRYDKFPDIDGNQVVEDFKILIGKEVIDTKTFMDMMKSVKKWSPEKQIRAMVKLQNHPMSKILEKKQHNLDEVNDVSSAKKKAMVRWNFC